MKGPQMTHEDAADWTSRKPGRYLAYIPTEEDGKWWECRSYEGPEGVCTEAREIPAAQQPKASGEL